MKCSGVSFEFRWIGRHVFTHAQPSVDRRHVMYDARRRLWLWLIISDLVEMRGTVKIQGFPSSTLAWSAGTTYSGRALPTPNWPASTTKSARDRPRWPMAIGLSLCLIKKSGSPISSASPWRHINRPTSFVRMLFKMQPAQQPQLGRHTNRVGASTGPAHQPTLYYLNRPGTSTGPAPSPSDRADRNHPYADVHTGSKFADAPTVYEMTSPSPLVTGSVDTSCDDILWTAIVQKIWKMSSEVFAYIIIGSWMTNGDWAIHHVII